MSLPERPIRTYLRRLRCRLGWHRWQYLLAPPIWKIRDQYEPGIWCIFCGAKHHKKPGRIFE